jgi:hypothetical protein
MLRKITLLLAITLWSSGSLLLPKEAFAQTPLTRAVIQSLRNQVRLIPKNQSARPARTSDAMTPGDALATAKSSTAQLRFNDGSLARLGEQAVFKFNPGSRTLDLSNGTALVLIPPKRGTTRVRTPNAAAGIRGSALFVRYIPETDTTIVGALTTSGIEVFNEGSSQRQELKAGNMAVVVKDRIEKVYEFDLKTFYQTSELVSGLNLTKSESTPSLDEAIAQVQEETFQALQEQSPLVGTQVVENPNFIQLSASRSEDFPPIDSDVINDNSPSSRQRNVNLPGNNRNATDVRTLLEGGVIQIDQNRPQFPSGGNTGGNFPGGGNTGGNFPGGGNTGGNFPGGGNTGGNFPGGGNTGGNFPGGGNTGGNFPGGGNTGGNFPGGGNTGGNFPGGGNTGGNFPGGGNTGGNFPGGGNTGGNFPGGGNTGGNFPGGGNTGGNFPGGGNTGGNFPGGGNTGGNFPGGGNTVNDDVPSSVNTPPNSRVNDSDRRINTSNQRINTSNQRINTRINIPGVDGNITGTGDIPTITPATTQ